MNLHSLARRVGASAALVGVSALVAGAGAAPADVSTAGGSAPVIGPKGVGLVKIGKRYETLRRQKLIGKIRPGCELGGPNTRSAPLKSPLKGQIDFTQKSPRKVTNINITGGTAKTARGIGIGSTLDEVTAAYPNANVDHSSEEVFEFTLVVVPKSDGGKFSLAVSTKTGKTEIVGVPFIAVCE